MHYVNSLNLNDIESYNLPITYYHFRKCYLRNSFSPAALYNAPSMECVPLGTQKEVMVPEDGSTWPGDTNGQLLQGNRESGWGIDLFVPIIICWYIICA